MNWDDLRHFSALASTGSLSAAARMLDVEHATVARRIASLEDDLGIPLVDRRGRRWTLTAEGERVATIADKMEADTRAVRRLVDGVRSELSGVITISAPPALAVAILTAPLVDLQNRHPRLTIRIIGEARTASLERGEADIAIRLSRPEDGDLTINKLGEMNFRLYANPEYLAATGQENWRFIGYDGPPTRAPQQAAIEDFAKGRAFSFYASSLEIQQAAARAGAGIAALPDFMATSDPKLVPVLPNAQLVSRDVWLVVHTDLKRAAPVRVISQRLREAFARTRVDTDGDL
ncbi:LysR family transcriptional regulator [Bradyrhizobium sp. LTSPM299]|uniref:LysR family transcriptional regulator n=1 Tax=Bradyrhizobium sp. LTSPM299 TaxID=1619233 RepID=UPI0005C9CC18|nr:LysR family transcriptional regulator [Bradyrhizobium sp. LTSPM299]KJC60029.1 LysR family transcriptional regulator [Bradyrhizobium sp. LTSPM299]